MLVLFKTNSYYYSYIMNKWFYLIIFNYYNFIINRYAFLFKKLFLLLQSYNVNKVFDLINLIIFYNYNDTINEYAFFH